MIISNRVTSTSLARAEPKPNLKLKTHFSPPVFFGSYLIWIGVSQATCIISSTLDSNDANTR